MVSASTPRPDANFRARGLTPELETLAAEGWIGADSPDAAADSVSTGVTDWGLAEGDGSEVTEAGPDSEGRNSLTSPLPPLRLQRWPTQARRRPLPQKKFEYGSRGSRLQVEASLVRLNHRQDVALGDFVPGLDFPFGQDAALNGLSLTGHNDRGRHDR